MCSKLFGRFLCHHCTTTYNVVNLDQKGFVIFNMIYKIVMLSKAIIATKI